MRTQRLVPLFMVAFLVLLGGPSTAFGALAAAPAPVSAQTAAPTDATLSGQIRDAATLQGLKGRLRFLTSPVPVPDLYTDANGNYSIVLQAGDYYIEYSSGRCMAKAYRTVVIGATNVTLNVELNRKLDTAGYGYACDDSVAFSWIPGTSGQAFQNQQIGVNLPFSFN